MFETFLNNIPAFLFTVRLRDILDIAIVAYLFYMLSKFVRETRAGTLIKGIILLLIFTWVSNLLQLNTQSDAVCVYCIHCHIPAGASTCT